MKQIFDWLMEQFGKIISEVHSPADVVWNNAVRMCIAKVDEAKAKWESEVCEWSPMKFLEFSLSDCVTSCGHAEHYTVGIDKYCRHCGKPIKISEVE